MGDGAIGPRLRFAEPTPAANLSAQTYTEFFLALNGDSWQKAFSLRVNKFIFNRADEDKKI